MDDASDTFRARAFILLIHAPPASDIERHYWSIFRVGGKAVECMLNEESVDVLVGASEAARCHPWPAVLVFSLVHSQLGHVFDKTQGKTYVTCCMLRIICGSEDMIATAGDRGLSNCALFLKMHWYESFYRSREILSFFQTCHATPSLSKDAYDRFTFEIQCCEE